jgi:regulator of cell morphogenesis and NO signaling
VLLVAYIVSRHHDYLRKALPFVCGLAAKVARVHGDRDARLRELEAIVAALADTLEPHMDQEEQVLFPAVTARVANAALIAAELETMLADHLGVAALLERMRTTTGDFQLPEWACTSYRTLFAELEKLDADVLRHVHLENHVLMPRFVAS